MSQESPEEIGWLKEFEERGETAVRMEYGFDDGSKNVTPRKHLAARAWLEKIESAKRDARDEETLRIAKEANSIALSAIRNVRFDRRISIAAIIIAAIAAHEEIKWLIMAAINIFR